MSEEHEAVSLTTITSTRLLDGLKDPKDRPVWQQFVDRYRPVIVGYACRRGLSAEEAEDAAQETLLGFSKAYLDGKYDRDKGRLRKWLFGIAHNQISDILRRRPHDEVQVADEPDRTRFFDQQPDEDRWEKLWEEEWRLALLHDCVKEVERTLHSKTVEAFKLFAWQGWAAKHVADHLGMTENAVYLAKYKVLKRIQELLPRMGETW